jgi:hypothetical protein
MVSRRLAPAFAAVCLALALPAGAINKCVDARGRVTYQEADCAEGARQDTLKIDAGPRAAPAGEAAKAPPLAPEEDKEDPRLLDLVATQVTYESCAEADPAFGERHGATYDAWRKGYAEFFRHIDRSPRYQAVLERGREQSRNQYRAPVNRERLAKFCESQFIPVLESQVRK